MIEEFRYDELNRPVLTVTLSYRGKQVDCLAIVDSGADYCSFPLAVMKQLGIHNNPLAVSEACVHSVGSNVGVYIHPVELAISEFPPTKIHAHFTAELNRWIHGQQYVGLLGQDGFFSNFKVMFDRTHGFFAIEDPQ